MRCLQLDFLDGELVNPAYALQINVSYILSDITAILGHSVFLMYTHPNQVCNKIEGCFMI